jgi:hypothetical protein
MPTLEAVKERPILFSGPMVKAILEGRKTQTRRVIKPQPADLRGDHFQGESLFNTMIRKDLESDWRSLACLYGQPGDRLWCKEGWRFASINHGSPRQFWTVQFRDFAVLPHPQPDQDLISHLTAKDTFTEGATGIAFGRWRSSLHMFRWASRITLEITEVQVERLQSISEEDAKAEGVESIHFQILKPWVGYPVYREPFARLWESINGKGSWELNPWVWAITFRRIDKEALA